MQKKIVIVCRGNIHRSVIAEACIRKRIVESGLSEQYAVLSRGVKDIPAATPAHLLNIRGFDVQWKLAEPSLRALGIEIPNDKVATPITREDAESAAVIFAMDRLVLSQLPNALAVQFPDLRHKMHLLMEIAGEAADIPDCAHEVSEEAFRKVTTMIHATTGRHWETLLGFAEREA